MKPFTIMLLVGLGFASGMLVPLIGLHATEDFARLEPLKSILLGSEPIAADRSTATAAGAGANAANRETNELDYRNALGATAPTTSQAAVSATPETVSQKRSSGSPSRIDIADTKAADFEKLTTNRSSIRMLTKNEIVDIQTFLSNRGHDPGPIDGVMGWATAKAIANFERTEAQPIASKALPDLPPKLSGASNSAPTENDSAKTADKASAEVTNPWMRQLPANSPTPLTR